MCSFLMTSQQGYLYLYKNSIHNKRNWYIQMGWQAFSAINHKESLSIQDLCNFLSIEFYIILYHCNAFGRSFNYIEYLIILHISTAYVHYILFPAFWPSIVSIKMRRIRFHEKRDLLFKDRRIDKNKSWIDRY